MNYLLGGSLKNMAHVLKTYAGPFPTCLCLTNEPSFTFLTGPVRAHRPVSAQDTSDLCDMALITALRFSGFEAKSCSNSGISIEFKKKSKLESMLLL